MIHIPETREGNSAGGTIDKDDGILVLYLAMFRSKLNVRPDHR